MLQPFGLVITNLTFAKEGFHVGIGEKAFTFSHCTQLDMDLEVMEHAQIRKF